MNRVYQNGDIVDGGTFIGFRVGGACSSFLGTTLADRLRESFAKRSPNIVIKSVTSEDNWPVYDDVAKVVALVAVAKDAATIKGEIYNGIAANNNVHVPFVFGCTGLKLIDDQIWLETANAVASSEPSPKREPLFTWPMAIALVGIAIIGLVLLSGTRDLRAAVTA